VKKIKISIIVPVYNVDNYLKNCLDSLINQTYTNIEIILVNDGSTDNSPNICDMYAEFDERVQVIHKHNEGVSVARNTGLLQATGDYIQFVDSDDILNENSCDLYINIISEFSSLDIVHGGFQKIFEDKCTNIYPLNHHKPIYGQDYIKEYFLSYKTELAVYSCIFNRNFLIDNNILFFKHHIVAEDVYFFIQAYFLAKSVISSHGMHYKYFHRTGSLSDIKVRTLEKSKSRLQLSYDLDELTHLIEDSLLKSLFLDKILTIYIDSCIGGELFRKSHKNLLNKDFVKGKAYRRKTKIKLFFFNINPVIHFQFIKVSMLLRKLSKKYGQH